MHTIHNRRVIVHTLLSSSAPVGRCSVIHINHIHRTIHSRRRNYTNINRHTGHLRGRHFTIHISTTNHLIRGVSNQPTRRCANSHGTLFLPTKRVHTILHSQRVRSSQLHTRRVISVHNFRHLPRLIINNINTNRRRIITRNTNRRITIHKSSKSFTNRQYYNRITSLIQFRNFAIVQHHATWRDTRRFILRSK